MTDSIKNIMPTANVANKTSPGTISSEANSESIMTNINTKDNTEKQYTKDDLKNKFKEILTENNIEYKEKDFELALKAFTNYNEDELLKLKKDEISKILNKVAKDYKTAINTGWTLKGISNRQKNAGKSGLSERLAGFSKEIKEKGFTNVSKEEQKRAIKAFFTDYFNKLENDKKPHDEIVKLQMQTFGRILINSSEEEKVAFKEVVKNLLAENISQGLKEVLESLDSIDDKQAFANGFTAEEIIEISETKDRYNNKPTADDIKEITAIVSSYKDAKHIKTDHAVFNEQTVQFIKEHKEELDIIRNKIENKQKLTDEEEKLLEKLKIKEAISSGEMAGTANNTIIETDERSIILNLMNEDNYNIGEDYYRDVIDGIKDYIEHHGNELNISIEEFNKILDKATNNNYTTLTSSENEDPPINPPNKSSPQETTTNNNTLGFPNGNQPNVNPDPSTCYDDKENITPKLVSINTESPPTCNSNNIVSFADIFTGGLKGLMKYKGTVRLTEFVASIIDQAEKGTFAYKIAIACFKSMGTALQVITFNGIHNTRAIDLAPTMNMAGLDKVKGQNIYVTRELSNIKEEKKEQMGIEQPFDDTEKANTEQIT